MKSEVGHSGAVQQEAGTTEYQSRLPIAFSASIASVARCCMAAARGQEALQSSALQAVAATPSTVLRPTQTPGLRTPVIMQHALCACQAGDTADEDTDAEVVVSRLDFWDALADLRPSLSAAELARYRQLREGYEGRDRQALAPRDEPSQARMADHLRLAAMLPRQTAKR